MLTKEKALYQVKLILQYLPEEEYNLIPKQTIDYIENNFEYDENIEINPEIPLENQRIDDKTYEFLNKMLNDIERQKANQEKKEIEQYIEKVEKENENIDAKIENIRLKKLVEVISKENEKLPKAKKLLEEYNETLRQKETEILNLQEYIKILEGKLNRIPKIIRKIFIIEEVKLLK